VTLMSLIRAERRVPAPSAKTSAWAMKGNLGARRRSRSMKLPFWNAGSGILARKVEETKFEMQKPETVELLRTAKKSDPL
jgi:hypothetical protein